MNVQLNSSDLAMNPIIANGINETIKQVFFGRLVRKTANCRSAAVSAIARSRNN